MTLERCFLTQLILYYTLLLLVSMGTLIKQVDNKEHSYLGLVAHICEPSTWEAKWRGASSSKIAETTQKRHSQKWEVKGKREERETELLIKSGSRSFHRVLTTMRNLEQ